MYMEALEPDTKKAKRDTDAAVKAEEDDSAEDVKSVVALRNDNGEAYFELSPSRRLTIRSFKGRSLVDIREVCCCSDRRDLADSNIASHNPIHSFRNS